MPAPSMLPAEPARMLPSGPGIPFPAPFRDQLKAMARKALFFPAAGLVVTGVVGLIVQIFEVLMVLKLGVVGLHEQTEKAKELFPFLPQDEGLSPEANYVVRLAASLVFMTICVLLIVGGLQMLRLRMLWLCVAACFLAFLNCGECCCVPSSVFAIWALILLARPDVRAAFE